MNGNGPRIGIVLSGWAPAMTLMSGVMLGLLDKNVHIEVVSTSGIGGLVGLLYLAPKGKLAKQALEELPNLFVSDLLYRFVPFNFKVFYKNSPFAQLAYELREHLPKIPVHPLSSSPVARFINDGLELAATALTPPSMESYRNALLSQTSMLEELVDFDKLHNLAEHFYLNAFDLSGQAQRIFRNRSADNQIAANQGVGGEPVAADALRAAQAMFLLFPPERARGRLFTTGATHDPTGLQAIWLHERDKLDMVIALDPLGPAIWRHPVNIHDAFQLMLLNPIVSLQVLTLALYAETEKRVNPPVGPNGELKLPRLYRIPFDRPPCQILPEYYPQMLEWTHANAVTLQHVGRCAGRQFADALPQRDDPAFQARYHYAERLERRSMQFLRFFDTHLFKPDRTQREKYVSERSREEPSR
jgi:predicted acylesterase/phospholipase RssA